MVKHRVWRVVCIGSIICSIAVCVVVAGFLYAVWGDIRTQEYVDVDGILHRNVDDVLYPVVYSIYEDFEETDVFSELYTREDPRVFTRFTLQSPYAPSVSKYVAFRKCIMQEECTFKDNRIDVDTELAHAGKHSLRFYATAPPEGIVSKASVDTPLLHFSEGDDVWFSAWFYIEEGKPTTIVDFETSAMKWGPGPRLMLFSDRTLGVELKHGFKPTYRQDKNNAIVFPVRQWVHVMLHLKFAASQGGEVEVWQDCEKIINQMGRNLPKRTAILDRMQLGITATNHETVLYVDDVRMSGGDAEHIFLSVCNS